MTSRRGFTLIELMVVVGIIVLIVAAAVPAFTAMTYSTERSLAENSLRRSMTVARDLALRSERGGDGAIVFTFDPGGRLSIVPAEQIGSFGDYGGSNASGTFGVFQEGVPPPQITRDVFVPSGVAEPLRMPSFWTVRGYAPPGSLLGALDDGTEVAEWYNWSAYGGLSTGAAAKQEGNWVFPETGLYDTKRAETTTNGFRTTGRQSFMIRFDAITGAISASSRTGVFIDPRPSTEDRRTTGGPKSDPLYWTRVDKAERLDVWASRAITDPNPDGRGAPYTVNDLDARVDLIGRKSNDTVLVKPVTRVALMDERRLARGIRARGLNAETRSLYNPFNTAVTNAGIEFDRRIFGGGFDADVIRRNINSWVAGDTAGGDGSKPGGRADQPIGDGEINFDPANGEVDQPEASLFVLSPYTGELLEVNR
ncbi:MAG: prepilin-type N-terminal cleavage/methylation domain-containing protein [Phycisphaerales bacterium]